MYSELDEQKKVYWVVNIFSAINVTELTNDLLWLDIIKQMYSHILVILWS